MSIKVFSESVLKPKKKSKYTRMGDCIGIGQTSVIILVAPVFKLFTVHTIEGILNHNKTDTCLFLAWAWLAKPKANVVKLKNQPLPKYLRKKTSKSAKYHPPLHYKKKTR